MDKWICHICGKERDTSKIAVRVSDVSARMNLPWGTILENVRFCSDNPDCIEKSKTKQFIKEINFAGSYLNTTKEL